MGRLGITLPSGTEWWRADKADLVSSFQELEVLVRQAQALQGDIIAEMESRGVMATFGYATVPKLLTHVANLSDHDARSRSRRAHACHDIAGIGGAPIPAAAPATAAAFEEGSIGHEHVDTLIDILRHIPAQVPADEVAGYETTLVELARQASPYALRKAGRHLLERINADGTAPSEDDPVEPERELRLHWRGRALKFNGTLDQEAGQLLETLLSPLAKPRPAQDGEHDTRSTAQRHGDALAEILEMTQRAAALPTQAGEKPALIITMTLGQLLRLNPTGPITNAQIGEEPPLLNWESPITAEQARRLACDTRVIPAVLGSNGEILNLGRERRLVTPAQHRALALRDKGCSFHGCTRTVPWTVAHHIREWAAHHGDTDIDNLCLLCAYHHRLIHHSDWTIVMGQDGHPYCVPPAWLDPTRKPRRNLAHLPITHPKAA